MQGDLARGTITDPGTSRRVAFCEPMVQALLELVYRLEEPDIIWDVSEDGGLGVTVNRKQMHKARSYGKLYYTDSVIKLTDIERVSAMAGWIDEMRKKDNLLTRSATTLVEKAAKCTVHGMMRMPGIGKHPWFRPESSDMRWLPINQDIVMPSGLHMPPEILNVLIEEASHRVIIEYCGCREGFGCKDYPADLGCLMLGDSALEIRNYPTREVGVEEARNHVARAIGLGLIPAAGKTRVDNSIYRIKDVGRLLTICFCCDCCCLTRFAHTGPLGLVEGTFPRLEGITVRVTERCRGCGKCLEKCYVHAITLRDGRAVLGERCRACGRCASNCPFGAIEIRLDDPCYFEKTLERIRSYVKHD